MNQRTGQIITGANTNSVADLNVTFASISISPLYNSTITVQTDITVQDELSIWAGTLDAGAGAAKLKVVPAVNDTADFSWGGTSLLYLNVELEEYVYTSIPNGNVTLRGNLTNYGEITWGGANISLLGTITNHGEIDIQGNGILFNLGGAVAVPVPGGGGGGAPPPSLLQNQGTLKKTAGGGNSIQTNFVNQGLFSLESGAMSFAGTTTQTSATASTQLHSTTLLSVGTYQVNDGTFFGTDCDVVGVLANGDPMSPQSGGIVHPGLGGLPGTIRIAGSYTQASLGILRIEIDAAGQFGKLEITAAVGVLGSGNATVGGRIEILRDPLFQPNAGAFLLFVTAPINASTTAAWVALDRNTGLADPGWTDPATGLAHWVQNVWGQVAVPGGGWALRVDIF